MNPMTWGLVIVILVFVVVMSLIYKDAKRRTWQEGTVIRDENRRKRAELDQSGLSRSPTPEYERSLAEQRRGPKTWTR